MSSVWVVLSVGAALGAPTDLDASRDACFQQRDVAACKSLSDSLEKSGDIDGALQALEVSCAADQAKSCFLMSMVPLRTEGFSYTHPEVMEGFQRACDLGYPEGCYNAGVIPFEGIYGATKTLDAATRSQFEKGCALDHGDSCQAYAWMSLQGFGGVSCVPAPLPLFEKACALGNQYGCAQFELLSPEVPESGPIQVSLPEKFYPARPGIPITQWLAASGLQCELRDPALRPHATIVSSIAVRTAELSSCDPDGGDYQASWSLADGAVLSPKISGGTEAQNTCVAAVMSEVTISTFDGTCQATLHLPGG